MSKLTGHFVGYPEHYDVKPPAEDGKIWTVQNPRGLFGFVVDGVGTVVPRHGRKTDYASIPRFMWRVIGPPTGFGKGANYGPAALIHDECYITKHIGTEECTRKQADQTMLAAMKELKVTWWRRRTMYLALRIGGRKHFGRDELAFPT